MEEAYKKANMTSYSENVNDITENVLSKMLDLNTKIVDSSGSTIPNFKIEPNTKSTIHWNATTGDMDLKFIPKGKDKKISVPFDSEKLGHVDIMNLSRLVKRYSDISKSRELNATEKQNYNNASITFDNAMNQITHTQQAPYNYQLSK